jgi:hypothetical protein
VRHKIARDPVVGVVQEDFQYFPDFFSAGEEALVCAVSYTASYSHLFLTGIIYFCGEEETVPN